MIGNCNRKKLAIAMIGQKRTPSREGGVEIVVEELSTRMSALGYEVTLYNRRGHHVGGKEFDKVQVDEYKGVMIKRVPTIDKKGLAALSSSFFAACLSAFRHYDIVHFHAEGPCLWCWIPKLFRKKVIATIHGLDWQRAKWNGFASKVIKAGERNAVKFADKIIVLSRGVQKYFKETYDRETIFIPNGVIKPEIVSADYITHIWNLTKDSYILYLGRIVPEKGVHYLINAFKQINTDKKLVIAGGSSDTDNFVAELKELAQNDSRIIFTGFVQGRLLEELYSNAYIFCLPSDLEGMPLSLLEAMAYGNCCITSDIQECTEVVEDKAVIFKKANIDNLREVLQSLLDNPRRVEAYKTGATEFICQKYNWDDVVNRTVELYVGK